MPLDVAVNTFPQAGVVSILDEEDALEYSVNLPASVTYAAGTILGELTATPGTFRAYVTGAADGSQVPKAILKYACATDAAGNITFGGAAGNAFGLPAEKCAPAYWAGTFRTTDLVGLDAGAVTALGRLISGTLANGVLRIG
jgi:hypothetical protein